jgi:transposase-like protein
MSTPCTLIRCPQCSDSNPAAMNRSDDLSSYRCDKCGHQWTVPTPPGQDDELPPLPAIGATGG